MEKRKSDKANLDKMRAVFKGLGFSAIMCVVFLAFTLKSYNKVAYDLKVSIDQTQEDLPPLIPPPATPPPPPPPPPKAPPQEPELEIVEDDIETPDIELDEESFEDLELEEGPIEDDEPIELEQTPMVRVEDMPHFPECKDAGDNNARDRCTRAKINQYIAQNFVLPDIANEMGYSGKVFAEFVVETDGSVGAFKILKSVHSSVDKATLEAIGKLPKFVPGKQLDKPVRVKYMVPVNITIN